MAMIWDMTDGSSKTLAITDGVGGVQCVAISFDGRLVVAGYTDGVRDL